MVHVKQNRCPAFRKVNFACDRPLHPKLTQYDLPRDHPNMYNTTLVVGTQGSGKTSWLVNTIRTLYRKVFHRVYVFMPRSSISSLQPNIFKDLPEDQIFEELNYRNIQQVYEQVKELAKDGQQTLIVYDDVQKALKDKHVLLALKNLIANQRHLHIVNLILVQNYFALHKSLRELANNVVLFKLGKSQTEKVFNELIECHRDKFETVRQLVYNERYNWLFINVNSQRLYRNWDEILLDEEEEGEGSQLEATGNT